MKAREQRQLAASRRMSDEVVRTNWRNRDEAIPYILAKITGSTAISGANYRWEYTWEAAEIGSTGQFAVRSSEAWYKGTALNVTEGGNTATVVMPGYLVANIPAGFAVKPIATGCYVMVFARRRTNGDIQWVFWCENAIDGTC